MKSQWKRLVLAAVISSSIFAATWIWYTSTEHIAISHGNEKPLAYVGKAEDDIQRRPASRLLWQSVYTGDALYNGEAIRTSDKAEARIQFAGSDRYLDLEPDSLIVIKKSEGEIALDLMEGSLFVNAKNGGAATEGAPGLVLNSASGKVNLTGASASLSKSGKNGVDLQVLEGKASMQGKDGQRHEISSGSMGEIGANGMHLNNSNLKIISPVPEKPLYIDPDNIKPVSFKWQGFPPHSKVALFVGSSRKYMKQVAATADGQTQEMSESLSLGRHFWKLVAMDEKGRAIAESPVYRTEALARYAPTVIFPLADAQVPSTPNFDMNFKWQKGVDTTQVTLEVWSDKNLQHRIAAKTLRSEDNVSIPDLKDGVYYWRMSAYFSDSDKPVIGKVQKFTLKSAAQINAERKAQRPPVAIQWTLPENQQTQYYVDKPSLGLNWKADKTADVAGWRVTLHGEDGAPDEDKSLEVKENKVQTPVPKPGRYVASIEALDKDGDVMGSSQQKVIAVAPLPLPVAPKFLPEEGPLKAGNDGRTELLWQKIDGAKEYELTIMKDGKELKKTRYATNSTNIRNLMPGEYQVRVNAVDEHGRLSEGAETRVLSVPDSSGLQAPKVKKIKVN